MKPRTLILRTAGTNCELELAHAFELAGASTEFVHLNRLVQEPSLLEGFDLLGLPGGFSYGDDIAAGRIFANRIRHNLYPALREFVQAGKPVIGICNGFQLLIKAGLLPGFDLPADAPPAQVATLADNTVPRFVDRWVNLQVTAGTRCIWTEGIEAMDLPIAHGEGRFMADAAVLDRLEADGMVALTYTHNPNGSQRDIAGICDPTGRVLGLMPHPERFCHPTNHAAWTRQSPAEANAQGLGLFRNAVRLAQDAAAGAPS